MPQRWKSREPQRWMRPWKLLRSTAAGWPVRATTCGSAASVAISVLNSSESDGAAGGSGGNGGSGGSVGGSGVVESLIAETVFSQARTWASTGMSRPPSEYTSLTWPDASISMR